MLLIPWLLDGDDVFGRHNRRSEPRGATKPPGRFTSTHCSDGSTRTRNPPLLAASTRPKTDSKLLNPTRIDQHYENLRVGMHRLFTELGVAA
jgi:hypothetical protein